ncbi:B12-binding domain-containing radical SAM protein [Paraliomyxa miuraensis]|uniref:B12-binding domain-containing radical SAM protein n=1 Tax=Paraliomyxa miuraensis TaxID=376150 RepID=UPI002254E4D5|nr:radical SAM protein [Paraliomyxa miuraensis]MCX4246795.1 radical SAM protein [Paraliomyxa miuraensis]
MSAPVRVLLLWPGSEGAAAGNFGVPQLVLLGTVLRRAGAAVEIRDLAIERRLGTALPAVLAGDDGRGYDVIALSVYSSFDHLLCEAIARMAREQWPDAVIVAGGYHPSARPLPYVEDGSPFDVVVVGEGERPLLRVVESVAGGAPLRKAVLGPEAIDHLDELPPSDWSLLQRYQKVARRHASQAQVYLSRGCPFDCAFCMERAKREVSWRPLSVERALEEIEGLHRFLDLRTWTLYFGDALFGMRKRWRREFLEGLARRGIPVEKFWLLIRVDLVEDEDLRLFGAANCGLGFGLESGDPELLGTIRKSGRLHDYLERMEHIAERAREHDVPWGANVICGHPGETPDTLRRSADYLRRLFLQPRGTTGFLSVDPFRLYPGSPIDADRGHYEQRFGTRFHHPHWWDDGDPEFLSEWVDPSAELDWKGREALQHELLTPILAQVESKFVYRGSARGYFMGAIRDQVAYARPASRMPALERYYAWQGYLGRRAHAERERRGHGALAEVARQRRAARRATVADRAGLPPTHLILDAIESVPRERFVPVEAIDDSTKDVAVALDRSGLATVSAMHAYAAAYRMLEVAAGDGVLDLGAGTGYGAALLHALVGDEGEVVAVEIDPALVRKARVELEPLDVRCEVGDALDPSTWPPGAVALRKITVGFALEEIPAAWRAVLAAGTVIVAPLRHEGVLRLCRTILREDGSLEQHWEHEVSYVPARSAPPPATEAGLAEAPVPSREPERAPVRLTVLD